MSQDKDMLGCKVWKIHKAYNIPQVTVKNIILAFVDEARDVVCSGQTLRLKDIVSISPIIITRKGVPTLALLCNSIESKTGIPYHTVNSVVNMYLGLIKEDLLNGRSAEIRKLVSFHASSTVKRVPSVTCYMSASLRSALREVDEDLTARVRFNNTLRQRINTSGV